MRTLVKKAATLAALTLALSTSSLALAAPASAGGDDPVGAVVTYADEVIAEGSSWY